MSIAEVFINSKVGSLTLLPFTTHADWSQSVGAKTLKSGKWRAYIFHQTSPLNPRYLGYEAWAARDFDDHFIQAPTLEELVALLKTYPYFIFHTGMAGVYGFT